MKKSRLPAAQRRAAILDAVAPLFARYGPDAVTTRQLADAAGISEALLFRHFANKHTLYLEAGRHQLAQTSPAAVVPAELAPSTRRLVLTLSGLTTYLDSHAGEASLRQICFSLLQDGSHAQTALERFHSGILASLREDLSAAEKSGDCTPSPAAEVELWLTHHLLFALRFFTLPERAAPAYGCPRFELRQRIVSFALRGLGFSREVIARELPRAFT